MRTSTVIKLSIATAGAGLIVLAAAESVAAATFYSITDLGNWSPTALNNWSQQIVGNSITADGNTHAVLWQNGTITDLGTLGSDYNNSQATGINDLGQVVGNSYNTVCSDRWGMTSYGDSRGFLWQNGNMINLGTLDSNDSCSQAAAINNMGQVVGTSYARMPTNPYSGYRSFLWEHGGMTEPGGFYNLMFNSALDINDQGQVVGYIGHPRSGGTPAHAFVSFNADAILPLPLPVSVPSMANGINNAGQMIWFSFNFPFIPYNPYHHTFLWENWENCAFSFLGQQCRAIELGMLASDINDLGQVVGYSSISNEVSHALLWENGVMSDLNNLLLNNSGWVLSSASAINNRGQIVGIGTFNGQSRGFLLTPSSQQYSVPEPSETFALLALGFFGATTMLKRQRHASATTTAKNNI